MPPRRKKLGRPKKKLHWTQTPAGRKVARANLRKASRAQRRMRKFVCKTCGLPFRKAYLLANHVKTEHPKNPPTTEPPHVRTSRHPSQVIDLSDFRTAYAFGFLQAWLEIYADSHGIPRTALAHRVGELLQVPPGR